MLKKKRFKFETVSAWGDPPDLKSEDRRSYSVDVLFHMEFYKKYKCCKECLVNVRCIRIENKKDEPRSVVERKITVRKPCEKFWRVSCPNVYKKNKKDS